MIEPKALKKLIEQAGIGERIAAKLEAANQPPTEEKSRTSGHGAASEDRSSLGEL